MEIEFDQAKSEKNRMERDLPFEMVATFEWDSAVVWPDTRHEYGGRDFAQLAILEFGCIIWFSRRATRSLGLSACAKPIKER